MDKLDKRYKKLEKSFIDILRSLGTETNSAEENLSENKKEDQSAETEKSSKKSLKDDRIDDKITVGMSDSERAAILKNKKITAPIYEGQVDNLIYENEEKLEARTKDFAKKAILDIADKIGMINKEYYFDDVDVHIFLSKTNLKESITKRASPKQIAKLLPILSSVTKTAILIESHKNRYYFDNDTTHFGNLFGAYFDGKNLIPVRLGLKYSRIGKATLYVIVDQNEISLKKITGNKDDRDHKDDAADENGGINLLSPVTYSISQIIPFVNSKDILRYFPDDMLSAEQIMIKRQGITETVEYTNKKNDEKYLNFVRDKKYRAAKDMLSSKAKDVGYDADFDWRMDHKAPNSHDDTAHSLDQIDKCYGSDGSIYSPHAVYYYGEGRRYDNKAISVIRSARNNPDAMIKVYRAVPPDIKDTRVRNGDWVTTVKEYAEEHGYRSLDDNYRIIENTVPAKYLYNNGDSINEYGYDNGNTNEVYQNTENNVKLLEITYDDEGKVIPISKRFDKDNSDTKYSLKDTSSVETRESIAEAFKSLATTDGEKKIVKDYAKSIEKMDKSFEKKKDLFLKLQELKGKTDSESKAQREKYAAEIQKINDDIVKADESLLKIAAAEPFRSVVRKYQTEAYNKGYGKGFDAREGYILKTVAKYSHTRYYNKKDVEAAIAKAPKIEDLPQNRRGQLADELTKKL